MITIESGSWDALRGEASVIRYGVFVVEQAVPEELEMDTLDPACHHWLARTGDGEAVGTARLTPDRHIGRMAVLPEWRGRGVGRALLSAIQQHARDAGLETLHLNAQVSAIAFYEKQGFTVEGPEFMEAGIPHRAMYWSREH